MADKKIEKNNDAVQPGPGFRLLKSGASFHWKNRAWKRQKDVKVFKNGKEELIKTINKNCFVPENIVKASGVSADIFESEVSVLPDFKKK